MKFQYLLIIILFFANISCSSEEVKDVNDPVGSEEDSYTKIECSGDTVADYGKDIYVTLPDFTSPDCYELINFKDIDDPINDRRWVCSVLLPPSYNDEPDRYYPVVYLLHGISATPFVWDESFGLKKMLDYFHTNEGLPEVIVVLPEAENTYYVNGFQDNIRYEDYFFDVMLPTIESDYRIKRDKSHRLIGGFSMGGYGSAYYAMKYNNMFSLCFAMTAPLDGKGLSATMEPVATYMEGKELSELPYFIFDVGHEDFFVEANIKTHIYFKQIGFDHKFILRNGGHNEKFWKESLYLLFSSLPSFL